MGKLTGMILILCGCAGMLWNWWAGQRRRQAEAKEFIRLIACWEYSLERKQMRLFDFLDSYDCQEPRVHHMLAVLLERLKLRDAPSGALVWRQVLLTCRPELELNEAMWSAVVSAEHAFFGENSKESLRCAKGCRQQLEQSLAEERVQFARKQSVYMPVGMLAGVLLVILLI